MKKHPHALVADSAIIATREADTFILHAGDGDIVASGFDVGTDNLMLVFHSYSDVLGPLGYFHDGQQFDDFTGQTHIDVTIADLNGDGVLDTRFTVGEDSITLLSASGMTTGDLMGG